MNENDVNNFIIGGGLAGMLFAYYNPSYYIISPQLRGQTTSEIQLGPRFLKYSEKLKKLILEIGLVPLKKRINYSFYDGDEKIKKQDVNLEKTEDFKDYFFPHTLEKDNPFDFDNTLNIHGNRNFKAFKPDLKKISKNLENHIAYQHIHGEVTDIDIKAKSLIINNDRKLNFHNIVSTIPLPQFLEMATGKDRDFKIKPITFVRVEKKFFDIDTDYAYFTNKPWYRLTDTGAYLIAEIIGRKDKEELKEIFGEDYDNHIVKKIQVVNSVKVEQLNKNVKFIGRYGQWDKEKTVKEVLDDIIKKQKNKKVI